MSRSILFALMLVFSASNMQSAVGQFTDTPAEDVVVNASETVSILCSHANASSILWRRAGTPISGATPGFGVSSSSEEQSTLSIESASPDVHSGNYACIATLDGGQEETAAFDVTVQFLGSVSLRVVVEECAAGVLYLDARATLHCEVSDAEPPLEASATEWYREGSTRVRITEGGASRISVDGNMLVIGQAMSADTSDYFCRVTNGVFVMESRRVEVSVLTLFPARQLKLVVNGRAVQSNRENILVKRGGQVAINCLVNPPYTTFAISDVRWRRNAAGIVSDENGVTLFSNPSQPCNFTLFIANTTSSNEGLYSCELSGDNTNAQLTLAKIPQSYNVTTDPPNASLLGVEKAITFLCLTDPSEDLLVNVEESISWQFSGSETTAAVDVMGDGERVFVEGRNLTIAGLRVEDSGTYVCVADNALVDPIRTPVSLTVEAAFEVTITPPVPVVKLGKPLTLTCASTSPRPASFSWAIGGTTVAPSDRLTVTSGPNSQSSLLAISSLALSDLAAVSCTVSDPLHLDRSNAVFVTETGQLYLIGDRMNGTLNVPNGGQLRLECPIRARSDSTSVRWFAGNRELRDAEAGVQLLNGSTVAVLGVASLEEDEGDRYMCVVADGGIMLSYEITLYITVPGNITGHPPSNVNATAGTRFQLRCTVSGRPAPRITWYQGQLVNISEQNLPSIIDFGNGSLVFRNVTVEDSGTYLCLITEPSVLTRRTSLKVMMEATPPVVPPGSRGSGVLGLTRDETILVFVMVGVVACFFLLMIALLLGMCFCCCMDRFSRDKYLVAKSGAYDTGPFKQRDSARGGSRKDNSEVLMVTPTPIFDTLQRYPEPTLNEMYADSGNNSAMPLNTFAMMGSGSLLTESQTSSPMRGTMVTTPSHNSMSSPLHGTMATTSIFSSEGHTTLASGLPNFPRTNVKLGELLGQGEFGPVMHAVAQHLVPGEAETEVAVKLLVTEALEDTGFRADLAMVDYANHMKLRYRSIAAILGLCSEEEPYYVMYEYLDKGDLKNFLLSSRPEEGVPPKLMDHELLRMIGQVADGMAYLFSQRIIHGDIASRNCLVSSSLQVKIGDLGIGHELYTGDYYDNGAQLLPIRWMPPELLVESEEGPSFSLHSDTWSFGVFCWEVMTFGRLPYDNYSDEDVLAMIPAGSRLRSPSGSCPPALYLVMMEAWNEAPDLRPPFSKILSALASINLDDV